MLPISTAAKSRASASIKSNNARSVALNVYRIEHETLTLTEISKRLGLHPATLRNRMRELRGASGPITWQRLRG
jgi:predicted ArsR family transcriptional regulator